MKVSYYPGCSLHATGKEYDLSVKAVSSALGIELAEIRDWSCCGATSAHNTNFKLSLALPARNLMIAEQDAQGEATEVMVPCAACFNRFKSAQHYLAKDVELKKEVEEAVGGAYRGTLSIRSPLDIFYRDIGPEELAERVKRPLRGLKTVSYYGCLLLRPPEVCRFDAHENPLIMDQILTLMGADPRFWSYKTDCCGGSLTISKTSIVESMVNRLMKMAREAGADCVVTACPVCMANLDMRAGQDLRLPVFYFTELMALAMGLPGPANWFALHNVDPGPLMNKLGLG